MRQKSEKELFIIQNYENMTSTQIANTLNIPVHQIEYYVRKNNMNHKRFYFSEEENQFMKDHYLDMTYREIAEHLGYTEKQIRSRISNLGLRKNRTITDNYFESIDTPLKAYFLGFIFADGWIVINCKNRNYEFGMELQSCDKYVLEKLNSELGGQNIICHKNPHDVLINGKIAHSNDSDVLRVYSKKLVLDLKRNGIAQNKTLKDVYPIVNDDLFFDFLRGYIDGDGCYWRSKKYYYLQITCATSSVLEYIQTKLSGYRINTQLYFESNRKYRLMCTNIKDMRLLVNKMYYSDNLFYLSRKYERIKSYLGSAA